MRKLFLDDFRVPKDCIHYMNSRIGSENTIYLEDWDVVKDYDEFVHNIETNGMPDVISFDHDLADEHYDSSMYDLNEEYNNRYSNFREKTGYDCAIWLCEYCSEREIPLPKYFVHSMNPIGSDNIKNVLNNYTKFFNSK
jgi:hypothetical protein